MFLRISAVFKDIALEYGDKLSSVNRVMDLRKAGAAFLRFFLFCWGAGLSKKVFREKVIQNDLNTASTFVALKEFERAAEKYRTIINKKPEFVMAHIAYVKCLLELKQNEEANAALNKCLANLSLDFELRIEIHIALVKSVSSNGNNYQAWLDFKSCLDVLQYASQYQLTELVAAVKHLSSNDVAFLFLHHISIHALRYPKIIYSIALQYYKRDNLTRSICTLLMLDNLSEQPNHTINLLVVCVCETHATNVGPMWRKANRFLFKYYNVKKPTFGYWSLWLDLFGDAVDGAAKQGLNVNTDIEKILTSFSLNYFNNIQHRERFVLEKEGADIVDIPKRIISFSSVEEGCLHYGTDKLYGEYHIEFFDITKATAFIAKHYTNRIYQAWRLCRNISDKEQLFKLCYLVKYGGVYISYKTKSLSSLTMHMLDNRYSLQLAKGFMGIDTRFVIAAPNHPLLIAILQYVLENLLSGCRLPSHYTTGSLCWASIYCQYLDALKKRKKTQNVNVISAMMMETIFSENG